jgi:CheY-like chemotaxis protein
MSAARKLLLVDDSPIARMMVQTVLRGSGFELREAHDGAQALALVHQERPDLIVMDVVMPTMDGLSTLQALRADANTRDIPVVMLTSEGAPEEIERCFHAGCNGYVTKPINASALKAKIEAVLAEEIG